VTSLGETYELRCEAVRRDDDENLEKTEIEKYLEAKVVVCSHCKETGHFSLKCPKRKDIRTAGMAAEEETTRRVEPVEITLRIMNLHPDIEDNTFRTVIHNIATQNSISLPSRVFVVRDYNTRACVGTAYVSFMRRDAAERMVEKVDGYGLDNLILHAEIAPPREERPRRDFDGEGGNRGGEAESHYGGGRGDVSVARGVPWRK